MKRYVVRELKGFLQLGGEGRRAAQSKPGLSCMVLDTLWNYRVVGTYRSEDYARRIGTAATHAQARAQAYTLCAELNGDPPPPKYRRAWIFRATCPTCGRRCDPDAAYCACGKNLYAREIGH